jgi:hypothetical protein
MTETLATRRTAAPTNAARAANGTAPRVDLYAPIHKALRHVLSDTLLRVGRLDVSDAGDMHATLAQCDELLALCASHVRHENDFMHPAIEARQPSGSARIAHEHEEHLQSIGELGDEVAALRAAGAAARPALAQRLYRHLALFIAANLQHMHIEETAHNAVLWAHYSDAELMQLHGRLMASIDPREHLRVGRWMLPALTPDERAAVVRGLQAETPPEAMVGLLAQMRPHLDDKAWSQLAQATSIHLG